MSLYLDTSVLISLFHEDRHTDRVSEWMVDVDDFVLSAWTVTEFSSALAVQSRMNRLADRDRRALERNLDHWLPSRLVLSVMEADMVEARRLIRSDARLRAPDALHLAIAARNACSLATLDTVMSVSARDMGMTVVTP